MIDSTVILLPVLSTLTDPNNASDRLNHFLVLLFFVSVATSQQMFLVRSTTTKN
jgi:hypothetical protein